MKSITRFIVIKLKVNEQKSSVGNPWRSKFLGFSFYSRGSQPKVRIHKKTIKRFKQRVRELTGRDCDKSLAQIIYKLNLTCCALPGRGAYFEGLYLFLDKRQKSIYLSFHLLIYLSLDLGFEYYEVSYLQNIW